jgi:hypothetical protein
MYRAHGRGRVYDARVHNYIIHTSAIHLAPTVGSVNAASTVAHKERDEANGLKSSLSLLFYSAQSNRSNLMFFILQKYLYTLIDPALAHCFFNHYKISIRPDNPFKTLDFD